MSSAAERTAHELEGQRLYAALVHFQYIVEDRGEERESHSFCDWIFRGEGDAYRQLDGERVSSADTTVSTVVMTAVAVILIIVRLMLELQHGELSYLRGS